MLMIYNSIKGSKHTMPDQVQLRGGSSTDNDNFTGAQREVTVDTTNKTLRVHDGVTAGGSKLAAYDQWGRLQTADPVNDTDVANKSYVDGVITPKPDGVVSATSGGTGGFAFNIRTTQQIVSEGASVDLVGSEFTFNTETGRLYAYRAFAVVLTGSTAGRGNMTITNGSNGQQQVAIYNAANASGNVSAYCEHLFVGTGSPMTLKTRGNPAVGTFTVGDPVRPVWQMVVDLGITT